MKRILACLLLLCLLLSAGCAQSLAPVTSPEAETKEGAPTDEAETKESAPTDETEETDELLDVAGLEGTLCNQKWDGKTLKVLSVGNSFAVNANRVLYQIANYEGVEEIVLGILHIGGCSVEKHFNNAKSGEALYQYRKNTDGQWVTKTDATMLDGVLDEDWDVITITSTPGQEGFPQYYEGQLDGLIAYLRDKATNPDVQIAYHMSWAYPSDSASSVLSRYGGTRAQMYQAIVDTTEDHIMKKYDVDFLLPTGTAVENARTALGEVFCKEDGYHLNTAGEYVAGYMFFASLTGKPLTELKFRANYISPASRVIIAKAVNEALATPFEETPVS